MGNTRDTGYLRNLVAYDASGNIVLPANLTVTGSIVGYATTSYVTTQINNLINGAPALLDTLDELAAALGDDANFASTITTSIAGRQAALNGTGFVKISGTTISYDNSTYLTTSSASSTYLPLSGGTLTGALNGTSAVFSSSVFSSGNLASATGNQGANTTSATLFLGNRGYFSDQTTGAATIRAISTGTFWYSGTALSFSTNPGPDVTGTNAVERMRIFSDGNVFIGTSPSNSGYMLDVSGAIRSSDEIYLNNGKYLRLQRLSGGLYIQTLGIDSGTDNVRLLTTGDFNIVNGSLVNLMTVKNGGNVGIATTSPTTRLDIGNGTLTAPTLRGRTYQLSNVASQNPNFINGTGFNSIPVRVGDIIDLPFSQTRTVTAVTDTQLTVNAAWTVSFAGSNVEGRGGIIIQTNNTDRLSITSGGLVRITSFTSNGLVGTDAAGNLGVVNNTYTEIPTGTISYSMASVAPWAINNSFPSTIRNYTDEAMIGTGSLDFNSNINRGISFDLGSAKAVRKIVERGYPTMNLDSITVQYSTDNSNWTDIHVYRHVYGNTQKDMEFNPIGAIAARYWRWLISGWTARETQNYYTYEVILYT
jgi:hypothetical protein